MAEQQRESVVGGDEQEMVAVEMPPVMPRQDSLFRDASRAGGHGQHGMLQQGQGGGGERWGKTLRLAFQCVGVLYGDIGTSPLYVYSSTFTTSGTGGVGHTDDLLGVLSLIIYSFILFTMVKYVYIALRANDDGDGGTFALYSLISRHANVSLVPNQQPEDELRHLNGAGVEEEEEDDPKRSLSCRRRRGLATLQLASPAAMRAQRVKEVLETNKPVRVSLFLLTILATAMVISDACLTPAISVLSAVGGLKEKAPHLTTDQIVWMTVAILVALFAVQRFGTDKVGYIFAPVIILWLLLIGGVGVYNLLKHDISVLRAFNPKYIWDYFRRNRKSAWVSLGGVLLCFTGTEALFADLGYFSVRSIQLSFAFFLVPSVLLCYAGQAAFLRKYPEEVANTFYRSTPEILFWPTFVLAILASIIGSQAMISCAFATISHSQALGCFPRVKILHTSKQYQGQLYIPEVNFFLAFAACVVTVAFKTTVVIGEAHGICVVLVMLITTLLLTVVVLLVWKVNLVWVSVFFLVFAASESVYLSSVLYKFLHGGYIPVVISAALMAVMTVWHYVHVKRYKYELERAVSPDKVAEILDGAGDRLRKVPGVGLFYTELVQGIPPVFPHLIEKIPSIHAVLLFVSVKHLPVPHVDASERFLFRQVQGASGSGSGEQHRLYRCVARYGYRDPLEEARDFVASLVDWLQYYIRDVNLYGVADVDARVSYPSSRCDSMAATSTRRASGGGNHNVVMFSASASYSELARARSTSSGATGRLNMNMMMPPASGSYTERQQQGGRSIYAEEMMTPAESFSELARTSGRYPPLAAAGSVNSCQQLFQAAKMSLEEMEKIQEEQRFIEREMEKGVVYIMGESEVVAAPHSSLLKKIIVNYAYAFLRKNCRQGEKMLAIPRSQLLKVGMSYEI